MALPTYKSDSILKNIEKQNKRKKIKGQYNTIISKCAASILKINYDGSTGDNGSPSVVFTNNPLIFLSILTTDDLNFKISYSLNKINPSNFTVLIENKSECDQIISLNYMIVPI